MREVSKEVIIAVIYVVATAIGATFIGLHAGSKTAGKPAAVAATPAK